MPEDGFQAFGPTARGRRAGRCPASRPPARPSSARPGARPPGTSRSCARTARAGSRTRSPARARAAPRRTPRQARPAPRRAADVLDVGEREHRRAGPQARVALAGVERLHGLDGHPRPPRPCRTSGPTTAARVAPGSERERRDVRAGASSTTAPPPRIIARPGGAQEIRGAGARPRPGSQQPVPGRSASPRSAAGSRRRPATAASLKIASSIEPEAAGVLGHGDPGPAEPSRSCWVASPGAASCSAALSSSAPGRRSWPATRRASGRARWPRRRSRRRAHIASLRPEELARDDAVLDLGRAAVDPDRRAIRAGRASSRSAPRATSGPSRSTAVREQLLVGVGEQQLVDRRRARPQACRLAARRACGTPAPRAARARTYRRRAAPARPSRARKPAATIASASSSSRLRSRIWRSSTNRPRSYDSICIATFQPCADVGRSRSRRARARRRRRPR